jgi:hypothetical protein
VLKKDLSEKELKSNELVQLTKSKLEQENLELVEKLNKIKSEYQAKLDRLLSEQNQETQTIADRLNKENEVRLMSPICDFFKLH